MLNKVRDYRWELWLFFGVPVAAALVEWAIYSVFSPTSDIGDRWYYVWLHLPSAVAWFSVLAVSYWWVRRLKRPLLRLLWQHSLVAITVGTTLSLVVVNLLYEDDLSPLQQGLMGSLSVGILIPMQLMILVWFARRASRGGFKYALVFVGLTAIPEVTPFPLWVIEGRVAIWSLGFYFGGILLSVMLTLVALWVLHRADSGGSVSGRAIAALFLAALLGHVALHLATLSEWWLVWPEAEWLAVGTVIVTAGVVLQHMVAVGLAYLVRVREVEPYFDPEEQPPTDEPPEPPADEEDDFVGLYRRRV